MRKFPIFLVVDVSESMAGEPLTQLETGIRAVASDLLSDPYALETAWISVIGFAGRPRTLTPLTELMDFVPPHLPVGGGTGLGAALVHLMDEIDRIVTPSTSERKGDWKPLVFLMTDGVPTDDPRAAIARWKSGYAHRVALVAVSIGGGADERLLRQLTDDIIAFDDTTEGAFKRFIGWITNSVKSSTRSVTAGGGISLAKMDDGMAASGAAMPYAGVDDRYAVFVGKCGKTRAPYVIKYERHMGRVETRDPALAHLFETRAYLLNAAVPVQQDYFELSDSSSGPARINSTELIGQPACPHCRAPFSMAVCGCGGIHCIGGDGKATCPWCGKEGMYGSSDGSDGGFDIARGQG